MGIDGFNLFTGYLLIILIRKILSDPSCIYDVGDGLKLDVRTLGFANGKGPKYDRISTLDPTRNTFNWNGCFSYSIIDGGNCSNAAACYFDSTKNQSVLIATQHSAQFKYNQGASTLFYQLSNVDLTIFLICRDEDDETTIARQDDATTYTFYIQSRCCCPGMCHYSTHSLSPIVLVVIIIVIFVFVYIISGLIALNYQPGKSNRFACLNILSCIRARHMHVDYQQI